MSRAKQMLGGAQQVQFKMTAKTMEGLPAFEKNDKAAYVQLVMTNRMDSQFYSTSQELAKESATQHQLMVQTDPEFMAKALVFARNEGFMRLQPVYGLAVLFGKRADLAEQIFQQIIRTPNDLADFFVILDGMGRGTGGRAIKRAAASFLNARVSPYWVAKYHSLGEGAELSRGYSMRDLVRISHAGNTKDLEKAKLIAFMGKYKPEGIADEFTPEIILAINRLRKDSTLTDKNRAEIIDKFRLPHEAVTKLVPKMTTEIWRAVMRHMPVFATLKHLNSFLKNGVVTTPEDLKLLSDRLNNADVIRKAKILPFRFVSAYRAIQRDSSSFSVSIRKNEAQVLDIIRGGIEAAAANLPALPGRTAIFIDVSGSMSGERIDNAALFGLSLFKAATPGTCRMFLFNNDVSNFNASARDTIITQVDTIARLVGGGTITYRCAQAMIATKQAFENVIVITDEQENGHSGFYTEFTKYRKAIAPACKLFVVNVAATSAAGSLADNNPLNFFAYGMSDLVVKYVIDKAMGDKGMLEAVEATVLGGKVEVKEE